MKWILLLLALAAVAPAAERTPPAGVILTPGANDAPWRPLFQALAHKGAVVSQFTERRWFPFHREPIVLQGELRLAPDLGLSLHYTHPEERTVVIDREGLLVRDAAGRSTAAPADPRATAATSAMLPILRFDEAELTRRFQVRATGDAQHWQLEFTALEPALEHLLGTVTVSGEGDAVRKLAFRRSAKQRIEIEIGQTTTGVTFTPEELHRFFR